MLIFCHIIIIILDNAEIGNLERKNRDHKKVPKQDEDSKFYYI